MFIREVVKNPPANSGDTVSIPGWGRSPGEGNGSISWQEISSIIARKIPCTEEPCKLHSMGSQKSWTQLSNSTTHRSMGSFNDKHGISVFQKGINNAFNYDQCS